MCCHRNGCCRSHHPGQVDSPYEQVDLAEEFHVVAGANRARLHEVLVGVTGVARAHEQVEDVVDVAFGLVQGQLTGPAPAPG